jgi:hypothetical protein
LSAGVVERYMPQQFVLGELEAVWPGKAAFLAAVATIEAAVRIALLPTPLHSNRHSASPYGRGTLADKTVTTH